MRVADLMTKDVACCRVTDPLSVAARSMWECDCGSVPVLDAAGERVVGMITDRDICMCTWMQHASPHDLSVSQAMSHQLYACSPDDSIRTAEQLMRSRQVRRVPVLHPDGRLAGILSLADIVRHSEGERGRRDREIAPNEITDTLAGIVHPARTAPDSRSAASS